MRIDLDRHDLHILEILQGDGRISNAELAERVALSPSACLRRMRALETSGLIRGYRARLNAPALGWGLEAYVSVNLQLSQNIDPREDFRRLVQQWPEVLSACIVTGETQYVLHVRTRDIQHYSDFVLDKLYREAHALDIRSSIVLSRLKEDPGVDLSTHISSRKPVQGKPAGT